MRLHTASQGAVWVQGARPEVQLLRGLGTLHALGPPYPPVGPVLSLFLQVVWTVSPRQWVALRMQLLSSSLSAELTTPVTKHRNPS